MNISGEQHDNYLDYRSGASEESWDSAHCRCKGDDKWCEYCTEFREGGKSTKRIIYECEICGNYHPWNWNGDCREDAARILSPEEYAEDLGIDVMDVEVRSMDDRVAADGYTEGDDDAISS